LTVIFESDKDSELGVAKPQGVPSAIPAEVAAILIFITCIQIFIASINKYILTVTATLLHNL
jgi:hypothetical protein